MLEFALVGYDLHTLEHAVFGVDDPTTEVLSPGGVTFGGDMNSNNGAVVGLTSYCTVRLRSECECAVRDCWLRSGRCDGCRTG